MRLNYPFIFHIIVVFQSDFAPLSVTVGPSVGGVSGQLDKDSGHPGRETLSAAILRTLT